MADLNKIIDELSKLTVVEAAELSKKLEDKWGVSAAAPVAAAAAPAAAGRRWRRPPAQKFTPSRPGRASARHSPIFSVGTRPAGVSTSC